jgi:hypothetical protein
MMDRSKVRARKRGKAGNEKTLDLNAAKSLAGEISQGHDTLAQFIATNFSQIALRLTPNPGLGYQFPKKEG